MQSKVKVSMLSDCYGGKFIGGGQIHIKNLTEKLINKHSCEVKIFSQKNSNIIFRFFWSLYVIPQIIISQSKNHFNIIHSHGYIPGLSAKIISILLKIPVIHTVHGSNLMDLNKRGFKVNLERFLLTKIKYDAQIVVSQNFLNYKNKTKTQIIIPNGVNLPTSFSKNTNKIIKLLFIGRLEKIKGIDILIKALTKIKNNNWTLEIIGNGSQKNELISLIQKSKLENKITFYDSQNNLSKYYKSADIFILPSLTEGQPITLLEAWSFKHPIIVTKVGSNPYIVENNKDGILVEPNNIKELSQAILYLIKNQKRAKQMGENGYNKVCQNFTWNKITQRIFNTYQKILKIK